MEDYSGHIVATPETAFGKPRINGTRFAVKDVVILHLYNAMPLEQIAAEYHLPLAGIYAAMSYYYDHKEETDKKIEDDEKFVEEFKKRHPSLSSKRKLAI